MELTTKEEIAQILTWFYEMHEAGLAPISELSERLELEYVKLGGDMADFLRGGKK